MALWGFAISYLGNDFAPWRWLLIRNNHLSIGAVVDVIILGPAFCYHGESKKNGEQNASLNVAARLLIRIPREFGLPPFTLAGVCLFGLVS
jgi:hypothetical protein